eukprot:7048946-Prymnesium_polylepis.1
MFTTKFLFPRQMRSSRFFFRLGLGGTALCVSGLAAATSELANKRSACQSAEALKLPPIGLGLWKAAPGEVHAAIKEALRSGYRLLDGAAAYGNEPEVGHAIAEAIGDGIVARDDLWVVSKLFNTHHCWRGDSSRPAEALTRTLDELGLAHVDLYLMHWPVAIEQKELGPLGGLRLKDGTPNPKLTMEFEYLDTWREMIGFKKQGRAKHLGVCNFTVEQLRALLAAFPDDKPEVNQVELHPYLAQPELVEVCREHGIALMAYSPLGSADSYSGASFPRRGTGPFECPSGGAPLLQNEVVGQIAQRHGCTPAQVLIAWSVAKGFTCLPKSVKPERVRQNHASADACALSAADMEALQALDCSFRYGIGYLPGYFDCPNAPWFEGSKSE